MTEHEEGDQPAGADSDADPERRPDRVRVSSAPDALWLASRGWRVTAVDVSATVLDQARPGGSQGHGQAGHAQPPGAQVRATTATRGGKGDTNQGGRPFVPIVL